MFIQVNVSRDSPFKWYLTVVSDGLFIQVKTITIVVSYSDRGQDQCAWRQATQPLKTESPKTKVLDAEAKQRRKSCSPNLVIYWRIIMSQNRAQIVEQLAVAFGTDANELATNLIGDFNSRMPNTSIYGMKSVKMAIARLIDHASKIGTIDTEMADYWKAVQAHYYKIVPNEVVAQPLTERKTFGADYVAPVFVPNDQAATEPEVKQPEPEVAKEAKPARVVKGKGVKPAVDQFD